MTERLASFEYGIVDKLRRAEIARQAHNRARFIWARVSSWLLATISVSGAFSGASVIADNDPLAIGLGVATALLSGVNAGLQPADKAAEHRAAAVGYNEIVGQIERLLVERESDGKTDWAKLRPTVITIDERLVSVEAAAPHVRPTKREVEAARVREKLILGDDLLDAAIRPEPQR
jgi:hypothetical protein